MADPLALKRYRLAFDGVVQGAFERADGLESYVQVIEYQETEDGPIKKKPGEPAWPELVLRDGIVNSFWLWRWHERIVAGAEEVRDATLIVVGEDGDEVARFEMYGTFPSRWKGPPLDADAEQTSVEELRLAVARWERSATLYAAPEEPAETGGADESTDHNPGD